MITKNKRTNQFGGLQCKFSAVIAMALLVLISALNGRAQQITGSIVGTVKDEQGAVIPGAGVKATNVDTNLASSLNGKITSAASPRLIQLGARLAF